MMPTETMLPLEKIRLLSLRTVQMRTFHITWFMFFVCFFGWFGLAPLMPAIRIDLGLDKAQIGNIIIASISSTIIARLIIGRLCDTWGPRKTAVRLLLLGSLPVFFVGLSQDYTSFLLFRLFIGIIGASFVITQFHTAVMFAPRIKGTANAITAGWGNLGGGVTNMLMPILFAALVGMGYTDHQAWRYAMILPGLLLLFVAWLYHRFTTDTPAGNYSDIRSNKSIRHQSEVLAATSNSNQSDIRADISTGHKSEVLTGTPPVPKTDWSPFLNPRVWILVLAYAMCFGMEITFDNVAALHFVDSFHLSQSSAGFWAGIFGFMNVFARALGGFASDKAGCRWGMQGKSLLLAAVLLLEGSGLLIFAAAGSLGLAILSMLSFGLFLKMANGATYGIVPFIQQKNTGFVSGIVGAGGNLGGMCFGFLFRSSSLSYGEAFTYIGITVIAVSLLVAFSSFRRSTRPTPPST